MTTINDVQLDNDQDVPDELKDLFSAIFGTGTPATEEQNSRHDELGKRYLATTFSSDVDENAPEEEQEAATNALVHDETPVTVTVPRGIVARAILSSGSKAIKSWMAGSYDYSNDVLETCVVLAEALENN